MEAILMQQGQVIEYVSRQLNEYEQVPYKWLRVGNHGVHLENLEVLFVWSVIFIPTTRARNSSSYKKS